VCDGELPDLPSGAGLSRFYRRDELSGDSSNWFAPTVATLQDWCASSGFDVEAVTAWPQEGPGPTRALLALTRAPDPPEWRRLSYELPLRCTT
jgi:hypothetical protein